MEEELTFLRNQNVWLMRANEELAMAVLELLAREDGGGGGDDAAAAPQQLIAVGGPAAVAVA
jgi:hypothetical protein